MKYSSLIALTVILGLSLGCDPDRKKKCEWYLMPDQDRINQVKEGFIPVCARNFKSNKQDCRLQTTMEFARAAYNKKFKYNDLKIDGPGIPRTITDIKYCE